jgi:hypothetical protein
MGVAEFHRYVGPSRVKHCCAVTSMRGKPRHPQLGIATDYTRYWARSGRQRALYESRVIRSEVLSDNGVSTGSFLSSYSH